jgi:hypothetical protein
MARDGEVKEKAPCGADPLWTGMSNAVVSQVCPRRRIIRPEAIHAVTDSITGSGVAVSDCATDDRACG